MKIVRIELWQAAIPTPAPFHPAWIPGMAQHENRCDLVRFITKSGVEGWSAAPAMGAERAGLGALLGPYFLGERADDIAGVRQRLREMSYLGWRVGWLEAACWDIIGKAQSKPIWQLLRDQSDTPPPGEPPPPSVQLYASTGELRDGAARAEEVLARKAEGFTAAKLRVHRDTLEEDVAQLEATRAAVGDDFGLMVDANQGWRVSVIDRAPLWTQSRARDFCHAASDLGLLWVEEPLAMDNYDGLAALRADLHKRDGHRVALAGGELNSQGLPEFRVMLEKGCYDVYQPDAVFTGGISGTWDIIQAVHQAGARYSPHTWTNGLGMAMNLQLFAASSSRTRERLEYPLAPPGWVAESRDGILTEPFTHERGQLRIPTGPGLGVTVDQAALRRHGHRFFVATPARVAVRAVLDRGVSAARALGARRDARLAARSAAIDAPGPTDAP